MTNTKGRKRTNYSLFTISFWFATKLINAKSPCLRCFLHQFRAFIFNNLPDLTRTLSSESHAPVREEESGMTVICPCLNVALMAASGNRAQKSIANQSALSCTVRNKQPSFICWAEIIVHVLKTLGQFVFISLNSHFIARLPGIMPCKKKMQIPQVNFSASCLLEDYSFLMEKNQWIDCW